MPRQNVAAERMRDQLAVAADDPGIRRGTFGDAALRIDQPGFARAAVARGLLGQHIRQQRDRFDVDALPADIGHGDDGDALFRQLLEPRAIVAARGHDQGRLRVRRRKWKIAPRDAAGDLQIDDAVAHAIAPHGFAHHDRQRRRRHRARDAQFGERAIEPRHMTALVDQTPCPHLADFVDAVGELIAAVFDRDHGVGMRQIAAIDVGNARHDRMLSLSQAP